MMMMGKMAIICVMFIAPRLSAMEGLGIGREGHFQSLMATAEDDYGNWSPAPGIGGGDAAPIPHSAGPCSRACLRHEASPSGLAGIKFERLRDDLAR